MIEFLDGILVEKTPTRIVLELSGIGYEVFISLSSYAKLPANNAPCRIFIHDHVREDQHILFGFMTAAERRLFNLLTSVTGIGPKIAMSALSGMSTPELTIAISNGDTARLSTISGIGRKTAERMVVELRDKLDTATLLPASSSTLPNAADQRSYDAARALVALGYKAADAQKMITTALLGSDEEASTEDLVRRALRR